MRVQSHRYSVQLVRDAKISLRQKKKASKQVVGRLLRTEEELVTAVRRHRRGLWGILPLDILEYSNTFPPSESCGVSADMLFHYRPDFSIYAFESSLSTEC